MKMKITRGHYNRKLLTFGAMLFLAIALISTGFAAWIMSSGAKTGFEDGNITVGVITESDLEFGEITFEGTSTALLFEPKAGDVEGDIKCGSDNISENLTFKLKTSISPAEYLDEIQITMTFPEEVVDAHKAGYIVLPAYDNEGKAQTLTIIKMNESEGFVPTNTHPGIKVITENEATKLEGSVVQITIEITIQWGAEFEKGNPSITLDADDSLDSDAKKAKLFEFKKTIYGLTQESGQSDEEFEAEVFNYNKKLEYSLTLFATVN
jgi:hypothetical protein